MFQHFDFTVNCQIVRCLRSMENFNRNVFPSAADAKYVKYGSIAS